PEHRSRPQVEFAQRRDGELQRKSARLPDTAFDVFGQVTQVSVAMGEFAPGVGDANDRSAVGRGRRKAHRPPGGLAQPGTNVGRFQPFARAKRHCALTPNDEPILSGELAANRLGWQNRVFIGEFWEIEGWPRKAKTPGRT